MKNRFFNLAKKLSTKSDYEDHKLGAVIVKGNSIVGIGFNKKKTHPKSTTRFNNIHAEFSAVLNAKEETLEGCEIYVYRETKLGHLALARPCKFCEQMLKQVGIQKVYYSSETGFKEENL